MIAVHGHRHRDRSICKFCSLLYIQLYSLRYVTQNLHASASEKRLAILAPSQLPR